MHIDDLTMADRSSEATKLQDSGYSLRVIDREEYCDDPAVKTYLSGGQRPAWTEVRCLVTPRDTRLLVFLDGAGEVIGLVNLSGEKGPHRKADVFAAQVLASQL